MPKIKSLSPKFDIPIAEKELELQIGQIPMGSQQGGLSLFSNKFKRGYGNSVFGSDSNGVWLGAAEFADAPFRVSMAGAVVATSITVSGYIATGGAATDVNDNATTISGGKITADSITASQIAVDTITASQIAASTITATELTIATLSAIAADLGAITAGTVTGATIRTASSGARFEISGSKGASYDSGGNELTRIDGSGVGLYGTGGNILTFKDSAAGTIYGLMGYDTSLELYLTSANGKDLVLNGDDDVFILGGGDITLDTAGDVLVDNTIRAKGLNLNYGQSEGNIDNVDTITGYNDMTIKVVGESKILFDSTTETGGNKDLSMFPHWGDFYAEGTKYFRVPHPDHPNDGWIQYASVESPEAALKTRGIGKLQNGEAKIKLPRHWELVTENYLVTVSLTPLDDCNGLFAPKTFLKNTSFKAKELAGGVSNVEFSWELTATRKGYADLNPEQTLDDDANRMVNYLLDVEKNPKKYKSGYNAKIARRKKERKLIKEKYKKITGKALVSRSKEAIADNLVSKEQYKKLEAKRKKQIERRKKNEKIPVN